MSTETPLISLDEAKSIVAHLEANEVESANDIIQDITARESKELFYEVGKLTRHLHSSLSNFNLDGRLTDITQSQIPDAQSRLEYVIQETEKAANTTMDAVERSMPLAESLNERLDSVMPEWKKLMCKQIEIGEFKTLCYQLDTLLTDARDDSATLNATLTEVLMAQGYQDLTGQVIKKVIDLVKDVEDSLIDVLSSFAEDDSGKSEKRGQATKGDANASSKKDDNVGAEGPIMNARERSDVVQGQDDVDDLLSSLGF